MNKTCGPRTLSVVCKYIDMVASVLDWELLGFFRQQSHESTSGVWFGKTICCYRPSDRRDNVHE
jgi:hypothetical protein